MSNILLAFLGIIAGVHAASYGAYKDSPYESFIAIRFYREILIGLSVSLILIALGIIDSASYVVCFLVILALSRAVTEFYKLFIRVEDQSKFLIPTQVHFFKKVVDNKAARILIGLFCIIFYLGIILMASSASPYLSTPEKGAFIGFIVGLAIALGGGYKDGFYEGFQPRKFARSPIIGLIGGIVVSFSTGNILLILLGTIGFERMIVELYKGFLKGGYSPGKFKQEKPKHPEWFQKRKKFIVSYVLTWIIFFGLLFI